MKACAKSRRPLLAACFLLLVSLTDFSASTASTLDGTRFEHQETLDSTGKVVSFFITHPPKLAPLVLVIGGSGCSSLVWFSGRDRSYVFARSLETFVENDQLTVLVVEKPFAQPPDTLAPQDFGSEFDCSDDFRKRFTRYQWADQLRSALRAARLLPWVGSTRILIYGQSEGAMMATLLAASDPAISDVALISGPGSGIIGVARDRVLSPLDSEAERWRKLEDVETVARHALASNASIDRWAFRTTFHYFASFARSVPPLEALESRARFYIAHGWDDADVSLLAMEQTAVTLQAHGRDVVVRRLPGLDHYFCSLSPEGEREKCDANLDDEQRRVIAWFLSASGK